MVVRPSHRQLEYLVALSEHGHFGDAALACNVSQPTLSSQIQILEDRLGIKLLERSSSGTFPTHVGSKVIQLAYTVLATLDEITNIVDLASANLGGSLRLGMAPTFGPYFLPFAMPRLRSRFPELQLSIREERPIILEKLIVSGKLDCALMRPPVEKNQIFFEELMVEKLKLAVHVDHPLAKKDVVLPSTLDGMKLLSLGSETHFNSSINNFSRVSGATFSDGYDGTNLDALRQMVAIGIGPALFPEIFIASGFRDHDPIVVVDIENTCLQRSVGLVWRKGSARTSHFEELFRAFKETAMEIKELLTR